jgi:Spy/CpxP family protein refolding chaperone
MRHKASRFPVLLGLLYYCFLMSTMLPSSNALQAKWTPNKKDDDEGGPLPLSQATRNQLQRLDDTIQTSSDPQATLKKIAQTNNMEPKELSRMLERNRRDQKHVSKKQGNLLTRVVRAPMAILRWAGRHRKVLVLLGLVYYFYKKDDGY